MIEVRELSKYFGDLAAVESVSFRVEKGQIVGFLGPNGAGKTTLMRVLTCYLPPTAGTAVVEGFDVIEESMEVRRRIGYLPEEPPLYGDMTVEAYLGFVAKIKGVPSSQMRSRIEGTMERTAITDVRRTVIGHLSKGFRQRLGLAQALVHNPSVLILDEPTVGLDPRQIIEIRELIRSLRGEHTIILSTHILPEASMTCDKVVIINEGRIVGEGTPDSLMAQFREGDVLRAEISGPRDRARELIQGVGGVIEVREEGSEGVYVVTSERGRDVRDELVRAIVDGGLGLRELRALEMTLEDIFLRLTTEDAKV